MESVRILYLLQSLDSGGTQQAVLNLIRGLPRQAFVPFVALDRSGILAQQFEAAGARLVVLKAGRTRLRNPLGLLARAREVWRLIRRERIQILHAQWAIYGLVGLPAAALAGCRVRLLSLHGYWVRPLDSLILRLLNPLVTGLLEGSRAAIQELVHRGLPATKLIHIPYGFDGTPFHEAKSRRQEARECLGLPEGSFVLCRVARFVPVKGMEFPVRALAALLPDLPEARLILVGDGPTLPEIQALAVRLGVEGHVRFTGAVEVTCELLAASDVFLHTSLIDELTLAALEAMAAGLPIVAVQHGPVVEEAVSHGENGLLVPSGDERALAQGLLLLARDPVKRRQLGEASRMKFLRRFDARTTAPRVADLYRQLLGPEHGAAPRRGVGEMARAVFSLAPRVGLVARPDVSPNGISAVVRIRGEAEWIEPCLFSVQEFADEILVLDNGVSPGTRERLDHLRHSLGGKLRLEPCPELDLFRLSNFGLAKARFRWVIRWDADFVAHTSGPGDIRNLRRFLLGLDPRRYYLVYVAAAEVAGDLSHQFPDLRVRMDGQVHTASRWARYVPVRRRFGRSSPIVFESLRVPKFYQVRRWEEVAYFHVNVKSAWQSLTGRFWLEWLGQGDFHAFPTLEAYTLAQLRDRWGVSDPEEAARRFMSDYCRGLAPFDPERCGPYPELLRPYLRQTRYRVEYRDTVITGRSESA
jgi:glycosyltransferase involved in cell wall biosynthesis